MAVFLLFLTSPAHDSFGSSSSGGPVEEFFCLPGEQCRRSLQQPDQRGDTCDVTGAQQPLCGTQSHPRILLLEQSLYPLQLLLLDDTSQKTSAQGTPFPTSVFE